MEFLFYSTGQRPPVCICQVPVRNCTPSCHPVPKCVFSFAAGAALLNKAFINSLIRNSSIISARLLTRVVPAASAGTSSAEKVKVPTALEKWESTVVSLTRDCQRLSAVLSAWQTLSSVRRGWHLQLSSLRAWRRRRFISKTSGWLGREAPHSPGNRFNSKERCPLHTHRFQRWGRV